jgi:UDP-N-acetylmuramyl pentapeptide phosphotransferase/UDP-N-acetylglucosamine-1-phosphate transferase
MRRNTGCKDKSNNRQRTVGGIAFFLSVLLGCGSVVYATEPSSPEAKIPNQAALNMLAAIAAAGASGQFDKTEQLFRQGKEAGLSELQMYEIVLNLLPYVGYPRTLSTMMSF